MKCDWCGRVIALDEGFEAFNLKLTRLPPKPTLGDYLCRPCRNDVAYLREDIGERGPREADEGDARC